MYNFYINYHTGTGNEFVSGTIDDAKKVADANASYTQEHITIHPVKVGDLSTDTEVLAYDLDLVGWVDTDNARYLIGEEVTRREWVGCKPDDNDKTGDIIQFGDFGFFADWQ